MKPAVNCKYYVANLTLSPDMRCYCKYTGATMAIWQWGNCPKEEAERKKG